MRIEGLYVMPPRCRCGHHQDAHHPTPARRWTWCGVWDDNRECPCKEYIPDELFSRLDPYQGAETDR